MGCAKEQMGPILTPVEKKPGLFILTDWTSGIIRAVPGIRVSIILIFSR